MDVFQNMELFSELIQCGGNIYTWCYNADGSLLLLCKKIEKTLILK